MDYCLSECIYIWFEFSSSDIAHLGTSIGRSLQHEGKGDHQEEGGGGEGGYAGDGGSAEALDLFERFCELRAQVAQVMAFGLIENNDLLGSIGEYEVSVGRLRVKHREGELVLHLLPVELLRILEQVDEGVNVLLLEERVGDHGVGGHLAEVAVPVVGGPLAGAVPAEQLVVGGQLVPRPDLLPLAVAVLHHGGVLHKGNVAASLNQTPEGTGVAIEVPHGIPVTVVSRSAMAEVTEVSVVPVVAIRVHSVAHIFRVPDTRGTRLAEVLGRCSHRVATIISHSLVRDQPIHGNDPARSLTQAC